MRRHTLGQFLREKRIESNLSQNEVGQKLGYHGQFISNWENNKSSPPADVWKKLMKIYKIPMEQMLDVLVEDSERMWKEVLGNRKLKKGAS